MSIAALKKEFFDHVWDHTNDEFLKSFENSKPLTETEKESLKKIICVLRENNEEEASKQISIILKSQPTENNIILRILQLTGSTRNKIITDFRSMLQQQGIKVPGHPSVLTSNPKILPFVTKYVIDNMRRVFADIVDTDSEIDDEKLELVLDCLEKATWSGWIRQERAKRSGHYAEYRLAYVLNQIGISFEPRKKLENPLSGDVQFRGISYDIVVPDLAEPKLVFKSTIHTANIGQFGESKDALEVTEAKENLSRMSEAERPILCALIDGIGLRSNIQGLEGVLSSAEEFCQFETLWKVIVISASVLNKKVVLYLPDHNNHKEFLKKYENSVEIVQTPPEKSVEVGEAKIIFS